jgi:tRNA pseudouridine38-40 synthase
VCADVFCHNMVRSLAGALLSVGAGIKPPNWVGEALAARLRIPEIRVAPPHALCLEEVGYPEPAGMAARAIASRNTRQLDH